jgi:preprotein translocase subunit SecD
MKYLQQFYSLSLILIKVRNEVLMLLPYLVISLFLIEFFACSEPDKVTLEFRIAEEEPAPGLTEMVFSPTGESFYLHSEVLADQSDVDSATVTIQNERPDVELVLTREGAKKFEELTGNNIGKRCGMVLNGQLVSAPIIRATISTGRAIIVSDFTADEAQRIAKGLENP